MIRFTVIGLVGTVVLAVLAASIVLQGSRLGRLIESTLPENKGKLHIGGETAPLRAGTCVHLPSGLVHCLENVGPGEMHVLGVFRPAGSPAEAYYPDGTKAAY